VRPATAEKPTILGPAPELEAKLKTMVTASFVNETTVGTVLNVLRDKSGINIIIDPVATDVQALQDTSIRLGLSGELSVAQWLHALADVSSDCVFVVRTYGLLLTTTDRARSFNCRTIPPLSDLTGR
jgi:hypothetical protein